MVTRTRQFPAVLPGRNVTAPKIWSLRKRICTHTSSFITRRSLIKVFHRTQSSDVKALCIALQRQREGQLGDKLVIFTDAQAALVRSVAHESRTLNEKLDGFEFFTPEFNDSFPR
jgi:hypothetical protein